MKRVNIIVVAFAILAIIVSGIYVFEMNQQISYGQNQQVSLSGESVAGVECSCPLPGIGSNPLDQDCPIDIQGICSDYTCTKYIDHEDVGEGGEPIKWVEVLEASCGETNQNKKCGKCVPDEEIKIPKGHLGSISYGACPSESQQCNQEKCTIRVGIGALNPGGNVEITQQSTVQGHCSIA